jgi:tetratricopeptide (TPR) repeat protein
MDRSNLHDLGSGRTRGEGSQHHGGEGDESSLRATRSPGRTSTGSAADAARSSRPNQPNDEASTPRPTMASPPSLEDTKPSWDEQSGGEGAYGGSPRRDRRESLEASTPSLIDEEDFIDEDEEQEMISYDRERLMGAGRGLFTRDESHVRRTPGAQMYRSTFDQESVRRTPGASQMHKSAAPANIPQAHEPGIGDASGLGFGLTLASPVASSSRARPLNLATAWESSLSSSGADKNGSPADQAHRPPLPQGSAARDQRGAFVSPWNLAKASSGQERGHGAYSPNTLRLTEDLGNLLLEDDNEADSSGSNSQFIFGSDTPARSFAEDPPELNEEGEGSESWTAPYVIGMDAPTRVPRSSTNRVRRGKTEGSRRSRGYDRSMAASRPADDTSQAQIGGFLQYTQEPTAVRSSNHEHFAQGGHQTQFSFGGPAPSYGGPAQGPAFGGPALSYGGSAQGPAHEAGDGSSAPRLLNFGGAFAPPSKNQGAGFQRVAPVPATNTPQAPPGPFFHPPPVGSQPTFPVDTVQFGSSSFHNPFQQPGPPQFGAPQAKFQPQFGSQNVMFGGTHPPVSQSPTFNFAPQGYPMHGAGMHPPPQEFIPVMHHQHQRPQIPQFGPPPQQWAPPAMEIQYDGAGWHSGGHGGWAPMGEYGYAMPRSSDSPALSMTPTPQAWTPEPDFMAADMHANAFAAQQQQGLAPSPGPAGKATKKGQRRGSKKGAKAQTKSDKTQQKVEVVPQTSSGTKSPMLKKGKKKQSKLRSSTPNEEIGQSASEDQADARRPDPEESPETKAAFKDFSKKLRVHERSSFEDAESFASKAMADGSLPESIYWKVYLELADLAKRANRFGEARTLYKKVCHLQPRAIQGWLEFSKLEEECGKMDMCAKILRAGIDYCEYNDGLFARAIKHEEKVGNLSGARELLSRIKHLGIDNVWRTVLEGALLEARAGNDVMARRVLKYLMHHVPWYGPLYLEAYKLEKNLGRSQEALQVVERGLGAIPRYGPLWFGAFRLCEELDHDAHQYLLPQTMAMIDRATICVSKEIIWKVHLEAARMLERSAVEYLNSSTDPPADAVMALCRKRFAMTILTCPPNLRWKVWLASGRMEVAAGYSDRARSLFLRAHRLVPDKGRAVALLECARLEEYVGDVDLAKAILCKSRSVSGSDWKVWLESVLLEIRYGNRVRAIELAELALRLHSGTGRLWASLVQLRHYEGGEALQFKTLRHALNAVPKSGEVWCEGARIHLNPFARTFDIPSARRHLFFATAFTPQYGDGFLETLRLEIIDQWLLPTAKLVWEMTRKKLVLDADSNEHECLAKYVNAVARALFVVCDVTAEIPSGTIIDKGTAKMVRGRLKPGFRNMTVDLSDLCQWCANADPNYGLLWFHCRETPSGTARQIFSRATELMQTEIRSYAHVYLSALIRRFAILTQFDRALERKAKAEGDSKDTYIQNTARWEEPMIEAYLSAPSLEDILETGDEKDESKTGMLLLESSMTGSNFVSGLVALCNHVSLSEMTLEDKRKTLFGADALFS